MSHLADKYIAIDGSEPEPDVRPGKGKRIIPRSDIEGLIATIRRGLNVRASISDRTEAFAATYLIKKHYG